MSPLSFSKMHPQVHDTIHMVGVGVALGATLVLLAIVGIMEMYDPTCFRCCRGRGSSNEGGCCVGDSVGRCGRCWRSCGRRARTLLCCRGRCCAPCCGGKGCGLLNVLFCCRRGGKSGGVGLTLQKSVSARDLELQLAAGKGQSRCACGRLLLCVLVTAAGTLGFLAAFTDIVGYLKGPLPNPPSPPSEKPFSFPVGRPVVGAHAGLPYMWESPANPRGIVFLAHGCGRSHKDFWDPSPSPGGGAGACPDCTGMPEERRIVETCLSRNLLAVAIGTPAEAKDRCWSPRAHAPVVAETLVRLQRELHMERLPVYVFGASSGAGLVAVLPHSITIAAVSLQIFGVDPTVFHQGYPATLFDHMPRDRRMAKVVQADLRRLEKLHVPHAELKLMPQSMGPYFFSGRIPGKVTKDMSMTLVRALADHGLVDANGHLTENPRRLAWKEVTIADVGSAGRGGGGRGGYGGDPQSRAATAQAGVERLRAMLRMETERSPIAEELNVAWAAHEISGQHFTRIVDWFVTHGPDSHRLSDAERFHFQPREEDMQEDDVVDVEGGVAGRAGAGGAGGARGAGAVEKVGEVREVGEGRQPHPASGAPSGVPSSLPSGLPSSRSSSKTTRSSGAGGSAGGATYEGRGASKFQRIRGEAQANREREKWGGGGGDKRAQGRPEAAT